MGRAEIEEVVSLAIQEMARKKSDARVFKWTLVPSKSITKDGLGLSWNAWHLALHHLVKNELPQTQPFTALEVGPLLLRATHGRTLLALRNALMQRIDVIREHGFMPL